jgi:hypothetical protein
VHVDKIKIIHNKKPIPSSKPTLADAFAATDIPESDALTLSVMVMGGAPDPPPAQSSATAASTGPGGATAEQASGPESEKAAAAQALAADAGGMEGVLPTSSPAPAAVGIGGAQEEQSRVAAELGKAAFWDDLQAFLAQRLKSDTQSVELRQRFEQTWRSSEAMP